MEHLSFGFELGIPAPLLYDERVYRRYNVDINADGAVMHVGVVTFDQDHELVELLSVPVPTEPEDALGYWIAVLLSAVVDRRA